MDLYDAVIALAVLLALALSSIALAQVPLGNPTQDAIAKQIGALVIANAQCSGQVQALSEQLRALKEKCGEKCNEEEKPSGTH